MIPIAAHVPRSLPVAGSRRGRFNEDSATLADEVVCGSLGPTCSPRGIATVEVEVVRAEALPPPSSDTTWTHVVKGATEGPR